METFVEINRFTGTCYRAANWQQVGITQGRGKLEKSMQGKLPKKYVLLYTSAPSPFILGASRQCFLSYLYLDKDEQSTSDIALT